MPALDALEHVDAPLGEAEKRACLGKVRPQKKPTSGWVRCRCVVLGYHGPRRTVCSLGKQKRYNPSNVLALRHHHQQARP